MKRLVVFWLWRMAGVAVIMGWTATLAAQDHAPAVKLDYKIAPSDVIVVDVVGEKDLEKKELRVSSTGTINFPYLEADVKVEGMTTADVARQLRELLTREYFVDPQIIVQVKEYKKRTVTVIGEVTKQGVVEFPSEQEMNLLEAIGYAGGFTQLANKGDITITRKGEQHKFNLKGWLKQSQKSKKKAEAKVEATKIFMLAPGDLVYVPASIL